MKLAVETDLVVKGDPARIAGELGEVGEGVGEGEGEREGEEDGGCCCCSCSC